jgi:tetratricopeptide (TPR) repeat protein
VALNKAHTSVWVKAMIIILIIAFVSLFMYGGIIGVVDLFNQSAPTQTAAQTPAEALTAINAKHQPAVNALKPPAESKPASYTAMVSLANAYFDWAQELSTPAAGQSQPTTAAIEAAIQTWSLARAEYDKAAKINAKDPSVQTDRAVAMFYSNDASAAVVTIQKTISVSPTFAPAWLNAAVFYESLGRNEQAIIAYKKYVAIDPKGQNVAYANSRLSALTGTGSTTTK